MGVGAPSGTVTFLFTDIEGSTRLFRHLGHRFVGVLDRHRELVRAAVERHDGAEVSSEGDGLFFAFAGAGAAIAAAVDAQRALLDEPWGDGAVRVRMGLHTGDATPHNGDYVALAVHQAARVREAAHGAQVVVSEATAASAGEVLPDGCSVRDLGTVALKDFEQGVRLYQVCHPALPDRFPPPRGVATPAAHPAPPVDGDMNRPGFDGDSGYWVPTPVGAACCAA